MSPLTIENCAALVVGGGASVTKKEQTMIAQKPPAAPETQRVRVLRAFYFNGQVLAMNTELDLPMLFALETRAANKVAFITTPREEPAKAQPVSKQADARKKGD